MLVDLHTHSNCSDGTLSPNELLAEAAAKGITLFAITDHDTLQAYNSGLTVPKDMTLIHGLEFSTTWNKIGVHIVGLNVALDSPELLEGVASQTRSRELRAEKIAEKLEKLGIENSLQGARKYASGTYLGRPHFAQYLVEVGAAANINQAFKRYLGKGKPGDIKQHWAEMNQVIDWIKSSGGTAVLAHPLKYKLTLTRLKALVDDFVALGGEALEVVSGLQLPNETRMLANLSSEKKLLASSGSDFHTPEQSWGGLACQPVLPQQCTPVWNFWLS